MGGNAIKNAQRFTNIEMVKLRADVIEHLRDLILPGYSRAVIPAYRDKKDFGDLDVLIGTHALAPDLKSILTKWATTHCVEFKWNSDVLSVGYQFNGKIVQLDFILVQEHIFNYALNYFAYNDLGNLIGRVAHKMGFTHGHQGLLYKVRDGDHMFKELVVTTDYYKALDILGFDSMRFRNGFDSLTDIFNFVSSSKYFDPSLYVLETRNHRDRTRDRKRKTYMQFLDYCRDGSFTGYVYPTDKSLWLPMFYDAFFDFERAHNDAMYDLKLHQFRKTLFNGELVGSVTGLSGKELGLFIADIREFGILPVYWEQSDEQRREWIASMYATREHSMTVAWGSTADRATALVGCANIYELGGVVIDDAKLRAVKIRFPSLAAMMQFQLQYG